jgi:hypothetical protein
VSRAPSSKLAGIVPTSLLPPIHAIGCPSSRFRRSLDLQPSPTTPAPTLPHNRNSQRLCASIACFHRAHTLRGLNDTAGITCTTSRHSSLVTRFRRALEPVYDCAHRLTTTAHPRKSRPHNGLYRRSTPRRPSLKRRAGLWRAGFIVVDCAILRQHVAPGHPFIDTILHRLCAAAARHAVDAHHQEHPPRYLPRQQLRRLGLLREWRLGLQRAHDRVQHRYVMPWLGSIEDGTLTIEPRESVSR